MAISIFYAATNSLLSVNKEKELTFLTPLAIALANFFVIKSVYNAEDNHAIVFMFLGMITALIARLKGTVPDPRVPAKAGGKAMRVAVRA